MVNKSHKNPKALCSEQFISSFCILWQTRRLFIRVALKFAGDNIVNFVFCFFEKPNNDKFSFLKEGLPSLKTACAPCMLGTPPYLVNLTLH